MLQVNWVSVWRAGWAGSYQKGTGYSYLRLRRRVQLPGYHSKTS